MSEARIKRFSAWMCVPLLWLFWLRLLHTAALKSNTFDEVLHILQGVLYWQSTELYSVVQNPPLINAVIGLPVTLLWSPTLPFDYEGWGHWLETSRHFMWAANPNGLQLIFTGRVAIMLLSLLLAAGLYRWSSRLFNAPWAGLLSLGMYTFDPNILAHSYMATTDLGTSFFFVLAAFAVWRYWRPAPGGGSRWRAYLFAAVAIGCLFAAKFSGILIVPALALTALYRSLRQRRWAALWRSGLEIGGWLILGGLVFLLFYRFDFEILLADYAWQRRHQIEGHHAFLLGETQWGGWWYYFPVVFATKSPLVVLLLIPVTLGVMVARRETGWSAWWPWLIAAGIGGSSLLTNLNIGYRHILPVLPFLYVAFGRLALLRPVRWRRPVRTVGALLLLFFVVETAWIHPHYLAYFNAAAGGPNNGWRIAVDSNIDWGQDIQGLAAYMDAHGIDTVKVSYLGTADLDAYGVNGEILAAWPFKAPDPRFERFYFPWPAPGFYAISATQLQGVYIENKARFKWFRDRPPLDKIGYSLFIYAVPPDGPPTGVALSGIPIDVIEPEDYAQAFESNDVRPRWYDARRSVLWPGGGVTAGWAVVGEGHLPDHPALRAMYPSEPALRGAGAQTGQRGERLAYQMFPWEKSPLAAVLARTGQDKTIFTQFGWTAAASVGSAEWEAARRPLDRPAVFGETLELKGYQMLSEGVETVELLTFWRVRQTPAADLKLFVHLIDETGAIVAQHDGLDVRTISLQAGDEIAQLHTLALPPDLPAGRYGLQVGVYTSDSFARLRVPVAPEQTADRLLLHAFTLTPD